MSDKKKTMDELKERVAREVTAAFARPGKSLGALDSDISPELRQALTKDFGIEPNRVQDYVMALMQSKRTNSRAPDPKDYGTRPAAPGTPKGPRLL